MILSTTPPPEDNREKPVKYKIAILYIAIGQYDIFWKDFFLSSEKFFLANHTREYFIFTDSKKLYQESLPIVHKIYQKDLGFTFNTLKRFEMFASIQKQLADFDFIFFFNANTLFVQEIGDFFLPIKENFTLTSHIFEIPSEFTFDRNKKSTAYIPRYLGKYYVRGGVNGGKSSYYLEMIEKLSKDIQINLANNIIAIWHDESHLNHYMLNREDIKVFHPGFCYAEEQNWPFEIFILMRNKIKYFGTYPNKEATQSKIASLINHIKKNKIISIFKIPFKFFKKIYYRAIYKIYIFFKK